MFSLCCKIRKIASAFIYMEVSTETAEIHASMKSRRPMYSTIVQENSRGWKRESLAVISDYSLDIYSPDGRTFKKEYIWLGLRKISREKEKIKLKFTQGKINLESFVFATQLYQTIVYNLLNIFTVDELTRVGLNEFVSEKLKPTKQACLSRILQYSQLKGHPFPKQIISILHKNFYLNKNIVYLSDFTEKMLALKYIIKSLTYCNAIRGIVFPQNSDVIITDYLTKKIDRIRLLEFISLEGKARHLCKFLDTFSQVDVTKISGIELSNSQLQPKHMASLSNFCDVKSIQSLSLHNAFTAETKMSFYTNFFTANMMMNLSYLNLDNTPHLDLINLIPNVPRLVYFSVANCDLLVEDIIHITQLPLLRTLDVSYNKCDRLPPNAIQLPKSLTKLKAHHVTWADGTLVNIFKVITMRKELGLHIDLSNANANHQEFERLSVEFGQSMYFPLISLKWNCNPVDFGFFEYLRKSPYLYSLHLDGIFSEISQELDLLCKFINITPSVRNLSVQGSDNVFLAAGVTRVVDALKSTTIKKVDVSNNRIPDAALMYMRELFSPKSTLEYVIFDGNHPQNSESFMNLIEAAGGSIKTSVAFPLNDFTELKDKNLISEQVFEETINMFKKPEEGTQIQSNSFNVPEKSPFTKPFLLPTKSDEKKLYITREMAEKMRENTKDILIISRVPTSNSVLMDSTSVVIHFPDEKKSISQQMSDFVSEYHMSNSRLDRFSTDDEAKKDAIDENKKETNQQNSPRSESEMRNFDKFDSVLISPAKKRETQSLMLDIEEIQASPKKNRSIYNSDGENKKSLKKRKEQIEEVDYEVKKREKRKNKQIEDIPKKTKKQSIEDENEIILKKASQKRTRKKQNEEDDFADINDPSFEQVPKKKKNRKNKNQESVELKINPEILQMEENSQKSEYKQRSPRKQNDSAENNLLPKRKRIQENQMTSSPRSRKQQNDFDQPRSPHKQENDFDNQPRSPRRNESLQKQEIEPKLPKSPRKYENEPRSPNRYEDEFNYQRSPHKQESRFNDNDFHDVGSNYQRSPRKQESRFSNERSPNKYDNDFNYEKHSFRNENEFNYDRSPHKYDIDSSHQRSPHRQESRFSNERSPHKYDVDSGHHRFPHRNDFRNESNYDRSPRKTEYRRESIIDDGSSQHRHRSRRNSSSIVMPQEKHPHKVLPPEPFVSGIGKISTPPYSYYDTDYSSYYPYSYSVSYYSSRPRHQSESRHRQRNKKIDLKYDNDSRHKYEAEKRETRRAQSVSKHDSPRSPKLRAANEDDLMPLNPYGKISDEFYEKASPRSEKQKSRFDDIKKPPKPLDEPTALQKLEMLRAKRDERPIEAHSSFGSRIRRLMNHY